MVRGKLCSAVKQQRVLDMNCSGKSHNEIIRKVGLPRETVEDIINRGYVVENRSVTKILGRPRVISNRTGCYIGRYIRKHKMKPATKISKELNLKCSSRTVLRFLKKIKVGRFKMKTKPLLKPEHIAARLKFAEKYVTFGDGWKTIVFSDEKKFCLTGPDGYNYYWRGLNKKEDIVYFSKDIHKKASIMIWAAFSWEGILPMQIMKGKFKSPDYKKFLQLHLLPYLRDTDIFQQDNSSIHNGKVVKEFFKEENIQVLEWPSRSPDLNPMEDVWAWIVRFIYVEGKTYDSVADLEIAIRNAWEKMPDSIIEALVLSMSKRMIELIKAKGKEIKY